MFVIIGEKKKTKMQTFDLTLLLNCESFTMSIT